VVCGFEVDVGGVRDLGLDHVLPSAEFESSLQVS
jgi:hypothetical protein